MLTSVMYNKFVTSDGGKKDLRCLTMNTGKLLEVRNLQKFYNKDGVPTKALNGIYGTITTESGKATVRIRQNWDVTELETDEEGNFETNLSLDNGGNYIMINYEDFTGTIELYSEYEEAEGSTL